MSHSNYIVFSDHFNIDNSSLKNVNLVGQKGMGLLHCPVNFTPQFFILTSTLFKNWLSNKAESEKILQNILQHASASIENADDMHFIVRSSAKHESFEERGHYKSSKGNIPLKNLVAVVKQIWEQNFPYFSLYPNNEFAIIIQQYVKPRLCGHLSNERRISRNKTEWLIEVVNDSNEFLESIKFTTKNIKDRFDNTNLTVLNKQDLISNLKLFGSDIVSNDERAHLEWVWSGQRLWIVQNDVEINNDKGKKPGNQWIKSNTILEEKKLLSFTNVNDTKNNWEKIECIKTFIKCGLPSGNIYILEDENVIREFANGHVNEQLKKDLEWLLRYPIIIRMDVLKPDGYNNILLPRTETIFTQDEVSLFLLKNTTEFLRQGLKENEFCFLIHRFIISTSCALAFSKPNLKKARIDSTWGIVDGLYYHPHDSFEVNLMNNNSQIKKQIRCKTEYLDVNKSGIWYSKKGGTDWDWSESLSKEQIIKIAEYNIIIADHLDSPVTVMYFVDVDKSTGYPNILPWFFTKDEITENSIKFTDVIFSEKRDLIQNESDFDKLKLRFDQENLSKITIKLKLDPEIHRNKGLIEKIGEFAKQKNIPIELEGSILSHTYYILRKKEAKVKCIDPFEPIYQKQKFYKLVRDKIPINIESKGEKARTIKVDSKDLLKFIKEKIVEEAFEFFWEKETDNIIEELADIFEVVRAACKIFGIDISELAHIADNKIEKKGGFETGIILLDTRESSLIDVVDNSGESLLINEDKSNNSKVRKAKHKKISYGTDNSITLPYFIRIANEELADFKAPVSFENIKSMQVKYTSKGIKIKFIQPKEDSPDIQIPLF